MAQTSVHFNQEIQTLDTAMSTSRFADVTISMFRHLMPQDENVQVYNVGGVTHRFEKRVPERYELYIFASPYEGNTRTFSPNSLTFNGRQLTQTITMLAHGEEEGKHSVLRTDDNHPYGVFLHDTKQIYFYFNVGSLGATDYEKFTEHTIGQLSHLLNIYSWFNQENQDKLRESLKVAYEIDKDDEINRLKAKEKRAREDLDYYKAELIKYSNQMADYRKKVMDLLSQKDSVTKHIVEQLEMLKGTPIVEDVHIIGEYINIFTGDMYINHDQHDARYYAGKYKIEIRLRDARIRFYNLVDKRRSYWGRNCHHPHVSEEGSPCLGNIATTMAELSASRDIYSLAIVCLNFLESVNTDDVAGKFIKNWDEVDDEGTVIKAGNPDGYPGRCCERCEETSDDTISVVTDLDGDGDPDESEIYCRECAEIEGTFWSNHYERYLRDYLTERSAIQDTEEDREYLGGNE